jgi:hypothetical protein
MWTEAVAMEQEFSPIVGVIVIGFNKGTRRNGERYSPFCRAKLHEMDKRMNFTNITGLLWKTVHPWEDLEVGEGLDISNIWMDSIPKDIMREQFAFSEPVFKNNLVVDNWLKQVVRRETDAQYVLEHGTLEDQECFFYQNFTEECKWCQYRSICTGATDMASLIRDGFMARREDHHATE